MADEPSPLSDSITRGRSLDLIRHTSSTLFLGRHALLPIVCGGLIYVLWRQPYLRLFSWFDRAGLSEVILSMRAWAEPATDFLPDFALFCLPDALWLYSLTVCLFVLGPGVTIRQKTRWATLGVVCAIVHEVGQEFGVWEGSFDPRDILGYAIAFGASLWACCRWAKGSPFSYSIVKSRLISLWRLGRPVMGLYLGCLLAFGYGLAHWEYGMNSRAPGLFAVLMVGWLFLHLGTLTLNAYRDADTGDVAMGTSFSVGPEFQAIAYYLLFLAGVIGIALNSSAGLVLCGCTVLGCVYSGPPFFLKSHSVGGPIVNWLGYGIATPLAGFLIADVPITLRSTWIGAACSICILGFYFLAQSYQEEDDRARGDDTLVARRGTAIVVQYGQWCLRLGMVALLVSAAMGFLPRVLLLLSYPMWRLDAQLSHWRFDVSQFDTRMTNGIIRGCFYICLVGLTLVLVSHIYFAVFEGVYGGFSTARGHARTL